MTTPTDREAKIAASSSTLACCIITWGAMRGPATKRSDDYHTQHVAPAIRELIADCCPPAPDGKALRELRAWVEGQRDAASSDYKTAGSADERAACNIEIHAYQRVMGQIDRLTSAPVADAEVAPAKVYVHKVTQTGEHFCETQCNERERLHNDLFARCEQVDVQQQTIDEVTVACGSLGLMASELPAHVAKIRAEAVALRADMLAVAQQVGIVYEADHHAPVAGPTPAILRAIAKMQRDVGDADQLRSAGLSLRAENARLQDALAAARAESDRLLKSGMVLGDRLDSAKSFRAHRDELLRALHEILDTDGAESKDRIAENALASSPPAALPQPKPAAEPVPDDPTLRFLCDESFTDFADNLRKTLTAAIPPLPIDEGRVRETVEAAGDDVLREWLTTREAHGFGDLDERAIAELCRRALAGKEPQP